MGVHIWAEPLTRKLNRVLNLSLSFLREKIRIFSLETGSEVTTEGRKRLSTDIHGGGDTIRGGDAAAAAAAAAATPAAIAAGASTLVVAAEVTSDNGLLAIACADSGTRKETPILSLGTDVCAEDSNLLMTLFPVRSRPLD